MKQAWQDVIRSGVIHELAPLCVSLAELAEALSERIGEDVSVSAMDGAWRRYRDAMRLPMLGDLLGDRTTPGVDTTWEPARWVSSSTAPVQQDSGAKTVVVLPDTQNKPGVPTDHLVWAGRLVQDVWPDYIVDLGDWFDFPSLNRYSSRRGAEGRRVRRDLDAGNAATELFQRHLGAWDGPKYRLRGNHERRFDRFVDEHPEMDGFMTGAEFHCEQYGWTVVPFLEPIELDGIRYCHYFPRSPNGRVMQNKRGAPSARHQVLREGMSCTAGHMQGLEWCNLPDGGRIKYGLIAGSFYLHDEDYLTPQGNQHWRGLVVKRNVHDGEYDPQFVSMDQLEAKYGKA